MKTFAAGVCGLSLNLSVTMDEMREWPTERITRFLEALAVVVSAGGKPEAFKVHHVEPDYEI